MPRPTGNTRLRAARLAAGYSSQQDLANALTARGVPVGTRQVRRWESANPPLPNAEVRHALVELLGQDLGALGFQVPEGSTAGGRALRSLIALADRGPVRTPNAVQPATAGADFLAVTRAHRRLYWTVAPATLHPAVSAHATLGGQLLDVTTGRTRQTLAAALAESWLLAGRMEFFDLREPDRAGDTWVRALQAAGDAEDALLGAAILAHMAFIPGWAGSRDQAAERMIAARAYARKSPASAEFLAWLDAVEAECETRCGNTRTGLNLIGHGEDVLAAGSEHASPEWMDWFSPVRLAAFKGNTQLKAGHLPQARETLLDVLESLPQDADKQRTVVLGDLAAVEAAAHDPVAAAAYAVRALELLETHWYATGLERVREVRRALAPWQNEPYVRDLDDRLYGWRATLSALAN
ncbi:transcriptional regulator [Streptomyces sp. WAC06614]|uniref:transcriptional regulator n=1 Tax=Streptomyces sp. WAC06614 TaxID=2487416 RepID=UPI000F7B4EE9|nr:transcriptional regulator [Streptomyces sp. WAC06614]RSS80830.1 transcriptional regulator [Streptomyces sp. WAC06614]